jgi:hypothetical protein
MIAPVPNNNEFSFIWKDWFKTIWKFLNYPILENDVVFTQATKGIVLKDTQATPHYWRVTVSNVGALVITDLGTTYS